ncbi:MAG: hypothetical protein GY714_29345 [Desulfobacterales bacterium]|nr:hypothetical protein [Desulfobacterales bacterium]
METYREKVRLENQDKNENDTKQNFNHNEKLKAKWNKFRSELKRNISESEYKNWIIPLKFNDLESGTQKIVLDCPNLFAKKRAKPYLEGIDSSVDIILRIKGVQETFENGGQSQFTIPSPAPALKPKPKVELVKKLECNAKQRMMPAIYARSALFGMIKKGKRRYVNNELIISWKGYRIRFKGYQLSQKDLDVWLEAFYRAIGAKDYRFYFTFYDFLKAIGRPLTGKVSYDLLDTSFTLLNDCYIEIEKNEKTGIKKNKTIFAGKLIDTYQRPVGRTKGIAGINPDIINLFEKDYIIIDWEFRKGLKGDLSKWKYNYIRSQRATTENPHWTSLVNIKTLCGSTDNRFRQFRANFKKDRLSFTDILELNDVTNDIWTIVKI